MTERDKIQQEILKIIEEHNYNGTVIAPTGLGKSFIMIEVIKRLKPKSILYGCDNRILRDKTFKAEVIKWGAEEYLDRIDMKCYQTIHKWKDKEYDLFLCDEGDASLSDKHKNVHFNNKFKHRLILSGTLSDDKRTLANKIAPIIYDGNVGEAEERGVVNKAKVTFVTYNLTTMEEEKYNGFNRRFATLLNGEMTNHDKFKLKQIQLGRKLFLQNLNSGRLATRELVKQLYSNHDNKILIFCGSTEQADKICRWSYHGKNEGLEHLEKFNQDEIRVLSVVGKIDRGINVGGKGVNIAVFEAPSRSKTKTMQQSGRTRRLHVDEVTNIYFMIPYYRNSRGQVKPTVVMDYVMESGADLDLNNVTYLNIKI